MNFAPFKMNGTFPYLPFLMRCLSVLLALKLNGTEMGTFFCPLLYLKFSFVVALAYKYALMKFQLNRSVVLKVIKGQS